MSVCRQSELSGAGARLVAVSRARFYFSAVLAWPPAAGTRWSSVMVPVSRFLLKVYKLTLTLYLTAVTGGPGTGCRFTPTCSEYFVQAVETHGFLIGAWLGTKRNLRCHPWGGSGYDPVPARQSKSSN